MKKGVFIFRETFSLPFPSLMLKGLFAKRWGTLGEWRNQPVHIISHFNFNHVYMINEVTIKEIIWTDGLPHLPGVHHLHVNRL